MSLIDAEYPYLSESDKESYRSFSRDKCSEYYFLGYMRCSNGNPKNAVAFYLLDDKLRSLLLRHLMRLEIQMKLDFVTIVEESSKSDSFWDNPSYYLPSSRVPSAHSPKSKFEITKQSITDNLSHHQFLTPGPSNDRAASFISFGSFLHLFQNIDSVHKAAFIQKYTAYLPAQSYDILNRYLKAIRILRNRCAHGNHVITKKMAFELSPQVKLVHPETSPFRQYGTVLEAVILFMLKNLTCREEFSAELKKILKRYQPILKKYPRNHSLSANSITNLNLE